MKIIIAGGTGILGNILISNWKFSNHEIVVLTRTSGTEKAGNVRYVTWDGKSAGIWTQELKGSDAIINLTGRSVNCRYTEKNKKEIISSRVDASRVIGQAIKECVDPPTVWINVGSVAIFGNSKDQIKDENSEVGDGFSPQVCKLWERAFQENSTPHTRKVLLRTGLVLQPRKGLLKPFINMVRLGIGGKIGSGEQYISWIHEEDFTKIVELAIKNEGIEGIVHCSSPNPVKNKEFMKALRTAMGISFGLPNLSPLIHLGAVLIGTEGDLVLQGRRVVSNVLPEKGYQFRYTDISETMKHLLK